MKQYTFSIVVTEGNDEFWEEATEEGKTGCDDVVKLVTDGLFQQGIEADVKLVKYEDR